MAKEEHLEILRQGVAIWNDWRQTNANVTPNLSHAILSGADLRKANLRESDLRNTNLSGADLHEANLSGADLGWTDLHEATLTKANLSGADLWRADLNGAKLSGANLSKTVLYGANFFAADLSGANLSAAFLSKADLSAADLSKADLCKADLIAVNLNGANLSMANLSGACLERALLVGTNLEMADLTECKIYGISAWDLELKGASQTNLVITPSEMPAITVDNLEVAQFIYLLLSNPKIRHILDTITSKVVLILGRFTDERRAVLDAIRNELRQRDYIPVLFDFDKPASKDLTGTVETLARMARFIIADLTDPSSIPHELATIVPFLRTTPVVQLRLKGSGGAVMLKDLTSYPWVLPEYEYDNEYSLIRALPEKVIAPAVKKVEELRVK